MNSGGRPAGPAGPVVLALGLGVLSWHTAWNLGGAALAVAWPAVLVVAALLVPAAARAGGTRSAPPTALAVVALVVAALVVLFVVGPPAALDHALGVGSDRADALDVALSRLGTGRYPYDATTYLGNPISPLPGALLLAAPAWALTADAGAQNVVWLPLLLLVVGGGWPPRSRAAGAWALATLGGLEVLREFVVGDDLVTGAVPAVAASVAVLRRARTGSPATLVATGVALGVATCTRPHLALVAVVVVAAVGARGGRRSAAVVGGGAALAWVALVTPFVVGGLARFSPLHVAAKVTGERGLTVGILVVAAVALAVLLMVLRVLRPCSAEAVGWCSAAVLFAPAVLSWLLGVAVGPASAIDLTLGAGAVPFAVWAVAAAARRPSRPRMGRRERGHWVATA